MQGSTYLLGQLPQADMLSHDIWTVGCDLAWLVTEIYAFDFLAAEALVEHHAHEEVKQTSETQQIWVGRVAVHQTSCITLLLQPQCCAAWNCITSLAHC